MRRIAVRGIILKNGCLLCVKLKDKDGQSLDFWCVPGGGVDDKEALIPGLEREIIEETGIKPVIGNLLFVQQFAQGETEHLEFFFRIDNTDDFTQVDLSKTTHGQAEIAKFAFIDPSKHRVLPLFLQTEDLTAVGSMTAPKILSYLDKEAQQ